MIHSDALSGDPGAAPCATRPLKAVAGGPLATPDTVRPGLDRLHGMCECGTPAGREEGRRLMADRHGQMWLAADDPRDRLPLPDFSSESAGGLDAGTGPQLWDALVLALAHQDFPAPQAREQLRSWAAVFGPMSSRADTGTVHYLPSAESVLTAAGIPSEKTRCLKGLRAAAAAHMEHGQTWRHQCGQHLTEALERVEGVTAASARAAAAAFHGVPSPAYLRRSSASPRPDLHPLRIAVLGPGANGFVTMASEIRPDRIPCAFTRGRRTFAGRHVFLYAVPDEPDAGAVRYQDAREMVLKGADGAVVLHDPSGGNGSTRPVPEEVRRVRCPVAVAVPTETGLRSPPAQARPRIQDDETALGELRFDPRVAASAGEVLQFLVHHIRRRADTAGTGKHPEAQPPAAPA
ncbi:hypothetical protein ACFWGI_39475 [Streptomyces niveus]|uniref:hypothetical protein n=1 Tax=Streptomyces niveus TaxID=193462 RepID=UPI003660D66B